MGDHRRHAARLKAALDLSLPPIAVAFPDAVPEGVPRFDGVSPAGCKFWELAAGRVFSTSAGDHQLCSIGIYTHNLSGAPASHRDELKATLEAMTGIDYVRDEEIAEIPLLHREVEHVVYGPLAEFPVSPEAVLLFAHARQGLVLSEAVARVDKGAPPAMGRPACAVVPQVVNYGHAAMSLGCCGARTYLDALTDDVALWALPGSRLDQYCDQIEVLARSNALLTTFHERRREDVASGERPSVAESLRRIGG